jgi:DNA primase
MFPLFDSMGRVVGFTGRIFTFDKNSREDIREGFGKTVEAKYVNTPETSLFQKSKLLYGYHRAKSAIAKENTSILVEGQMDFLAAWQEGIQNVIATSGTSLAETQLRQLRRVCDTIILGFDMDAAGETATERGVLLAALHGFTIKILTLPKGDSRGDATLPPKGKDIADFIQSSPGEIANLIANPKHLMEYYFENLQRKFSLESIEGKTRAAAYALSRLKTLASSSERSLWIRELAIITGMREDALLEDLARTPSLLDKTAFIPGENNDSSADSASRKTRKEMLAERALAFAINTNAKPPFAIECVAYFPSGRLADLAYQLAVNAAIDPDSDMIKYLGMRLDYEHNLKPDLNQSEELQLSLKALKELALKERRAELSSALVRAESDNNETEKLKIIDEINKLNQEIRNI